VQILPALLICQLASKPGFGQGDKLVYVQREQPGCSVKTAGQNMTAVRAKDDIRYEVLVQIKFGRFFPESGFQ